MAKKIAAGAPAAPKPVVKPAPKKTPAKKRAAKAAATSGGSPSGGSPAGPSGPTAPAPLPAPANTAPSPAQPYPVASAAPAKRQISGGAIAALAIGLLLVVAAGIMFFNRDETPIAKQETPPAAQSGSVQPAPSVHTPGPIAPAPVQPTQVVSAPDNSALVNAINGLRADVQNANRQPECPPTVSMPVYAAPAVTPGPVVRPPCTQVQQQPLVQVGYLKTYAPPGGCAIE